MISHPDYEKCKERVSKHFRNGHEPKSIREDFGDFYPPDLFDFVMKEVEEDLKRIITWGAPGTLDGRTVKYNWYTGPSATSTRWNYFRSKLEAQGHIGEETLEKLEISTTRILNLMPPPAKLEFSSRGLVMGHVQSGKTTNFLGLVAKAADEKYRLIVVLSGITNNLRDQTQERLESSLVNPESGEWFLLTEKNQDFRAQTKNAQTLLQQGNNRVVAVVKKNKYRLTSLYNWLNKVSQVTRDTLPVLIIDDECDQATPNTGTAEARNAINNALAKLLDKKFLKKVSYVGYSATPWANILSDTTDVNGIYPSDFIVSLEKSEGYFGAKELFGSEVSEIEGDASDCGVDIIRSIPNSEISELAPPRSKEAIESWTPNVTKSLKKAIDWFLLASAARICRGQGDKWSTMMVHTSSNIKPHVKSAESIRAYITSLRETSEDSWMPELKSLWEAESPAAQSLNSLPLENWAEIEPGIRQVISKVTVIVDNSKSTDRLNYSDDQVASPVIVVGGNTLSRGLTLEGLTSSFFLRTSNAYDSMMQMGRWFGYRPGYADLQRIWLSNDAPYETKTWFRDLAGVEEEIRSQIDLYALELKTPYELGIRIRSLPGMAITSAAKAKFAVNVQIGYGSTRQQTILFNSDAKSQISNKAVLQEFVDYIRQNQGFVDNGEGWPLARNVDVAQVQKIISGYSFHESARTLSEKLLTEYLSKMSSEGELLNWNVVIYSNKSKNAPTYDFGAGLTVRMANRSKMKDEANVNIKTLISLGDMVADEPGIKLAVKKNGKITEAALHRQRSINPVVSGIPLLGFYVIDRNSEPGARYADSREPLNTEHDLVGLFFVFPETKSSQNATYFAPNLMHREVDFEEVEDPYSEDSEDD